MWEIFLRSLDLERIGAWVLPSANIDSLGLDCSNLDFLVLNP